MKCTQPYGPSSLNLKLRRMMDSRGEMARHRQDQQCQCRYKKLSPSMGVSSTNRLMPWRGSMSASRIWSEARPVSEGKALPCMRSVVATQPATRSHGECGRRYGERLEKMVLRRRQARQGEQMTGCISLHYSGLPKISASTVHARASELFAISACVIGAWPFFLCKRVLTQENHETLATLA